MKLTDGFALLLFVAYAMCGTAMGHGKLNTYVPPRAKITATPSAFVKGQAVSFSASLIAPERCNDAALGMRIYSVDENSGEPTFSTGYLLQTGSNYDFNNAAGTKASATFNTVTIPGQAGSELNAVVWNFCTVKIPKDIDETGHIIWDRQPIGFKLGGATFHFTCAGAGKRNSLCAYRQD